MSEGAINLILIRHGNTFEAGQTPVQVGLKTDLPLTEKGRLQATQVAKYLEQQDITPDIIYCGQLQRQEKSAEIIGNHFDLTFQTESALNEIDYGLWEGQTEDEIKAKWHKLHHDWIEAGLWPKAIFESSLEYHLAKIRTWLESIKREHPNQTVVAVTSNGIIRLFLYFSNLNWQTLSETRALEQYKVKTGHLCHLTLSAEGIQVNQWNITGYSEGSVSRC